MKEEKKVVLKIKKWERKESEHDKNVESLHNEEV